MESRHSRAAEQFTGGVGRPDLYHDRLSRRQRAKGRLLLRARREVGLAGEPLGSGCSGKSLHEKYIRFVDGRDGRPARIAFFGNGGLLCVDFNGHQQWHVDLGLFPTMHGPGTSPVLYRDEVICIQYQTRGKSLFAAFDKRTGARLWQQERENAACWSTPVVVRIGDRDQLVYNGSGWIAGYEPETGKELWRVTGTSREAIPTVVVGGGLLISASGRNGPTMGIRPGGRGDLTETNVTWRNLRGRSTRAFAPLLRGPDLYRERHGDRDLYRRRGRANGVATPAPRSVFDVADRGGGRILVTSEEGRSTIFGVGDTFQVVAENDLQEPVLATPALLGGRLYFRTASHLLCVGGNAKK